MPPEPRGRLTLRLAAELARTRRRLVIRARASLRGERGLYFVLFVAVGAISGFAGAGFRWLARGFQTLYFGQSGSMIDAAAHLPWFMRIAMPAGGTGRAKSSRKSRELTIPMKVARAMVSSW